METTTPEITATKGTMDRKTKMVVAAILLAALIGLGAFVWYFFIDTKPKAISVMNYYGEDLQLTLNGQPETLRQYENKLFFVTTSDKLTLEAKNAEGEVLYSAEQPVSKAHGVWLNIISPEVEDDMHANCFASADVTNIFYGKDGNEPTGELKDLQMLTSEAGLKHYYSLGNFFPGFTNVVMPGKLRDQDLPEDLAASSKITAIFEASCNGNDNPEAVADQLVRAVSFETNYEDQLQEWLTLEQDTAE